MGELSRTSLTMSLFWSMMLASVCIISGVACQASASTVNKDSEIDIDKNAMGMSVLYDMVHYFLGNILHKEKITDSFLNLSTIYVDGKIDTDSLNDWKSWLSYMTGFAVCVGFGLVYIVFMPIFGAFFCCCRCCCGKCGGEKKAMDSKGAPCKRRTYCFFVIIFNTLVLAGVVCGFVCNSLIHKNLQNDDGKGAIGSVKAGLHNFGNYMNTSFDDASNYILTQYDQTSSKILNEVDASADSAVDDVLAKLNASKLIEQAKDVSKEANDTRDQLEIVNTKLDELKDESTQLQANLTSIKDVINSVCSPGRCAGYDQNEYKTDANFSSLDDLRSQTSEIQKSLDMSLYIDQAESEINKVKNSTKKEIQVHINDATSAINTVSQTVNNEIKKLKDQKDDAIDFIPKASKNLDSANEDVRTYSNYAFYAGLGVCGVYLLVVLLYYFGVLFGLCGERPGEGAPCCHTGRGANLLMGGVALTFLFSWLLMILCVVLFSLGGPMYTEVCRYFVNHEPQDVRFLDAALRNGFDIEQFFNESKIPKDFSISNTLQQCQDNVSLYTAMSLDNIVDLDSIFNLKSLEDQLEQLKAVSINIGDVKLMNDDLKKKLEDFANAGLETVDFTSYFTELRKSLTMNNLETMADTLDLLASDTTTFSNDEQQKLKDSANKLRQINDQSIPNMTTNTNALNTSLINIQKSSQLKTSIIQLITDLDDASTEFNTNKNDMIKTEISNLADRIMTMSTDSLKGIKKEIRTNQPKCKDLVSAFYSLTDSACILGLDPVNGLWFSFGWCLFFFIPTLIFAVLLAGQYRCELEYEKDFDEPLHQYAESRYQQNNGGNYQMYGGPNNDTIPLTRRLEW